MKYIKKKKEPTSLTMRRNNPDVAIYEAQEDWQKQLLEEQGYLCAYCMRPIGLKKDSVKLAIQIEHYLSQHLSKSLGLNLDLQWNNMLGVCNGKSGMKAHCDKSEGKKNAQGIFIKGKIKGEVQLNVLNPLKEKNSEKILSYNVYGEIIPNTKNEYLAQKIIEDLDCILNLNDDRLRQARYDAMDLAKKILKEKYPTGNWTSRQIEKEIEDWKTRKDGKYRPFCQAAIWFLEHLKSKPIHK